MTGILPMCQNEDGLAAVLGHEIAHNVAHHVAENLTRQSIFLALQFIAAYFLDGNFGNLSYSALDLVYNKPGSRKQEVSTLEILTSQFRNEQKD